MQSFEYTSKDNKEFYIIFSFNIFVIYIYITKIPIILPEIYSVFPALLYQGEGGVLYDMIQKIFDLSITEENEYRPRILSFLIQWIDINIADLMMTHFSGMTLRLYMGLIGSIFTVFFHIKFYVLKKMTISSNMHCSCHYFYCIHLACYRHLF